MPRLFDLNIEGISVVRFIDISFENPFGWEGDYLVGLCFAWTQVTQVCTEPAISKVEG